MIDRPGGARNVMEIGDRANVMAVIFGVRNEIAFQGRAITGGTVFVREDRIRDAHLVEVRVAGK